MTITGTGFVPGATVVIGPGNGPGAASHAPRWPLPFNSTNCLTEAARGHEAASGRRWRGWSA